MKDFIYGEGGAFVLMGIDEGIAYYFNHPDIIPHELKWWVPFIVLGLILLKRYLTLRMVKKA